MSSPINKTTVARLQERIQQSTFTNDGDSIEKQVAGLFSSHFPRLEEFWQQLIVPMTTRIEFPAGDPGGLRRREVSPDLIRMSFLHYSVFLHLVYANNHLAHLLDPKTPESSEFSDFYSHLGSVCDLAEDFLLLVYMTVLRCSKQASKIAQGLTRDQFCDIAGRWYDDHYGSVFDHYLSKGKIAPVRLPSRGHVLEEYFGGSGEWKDYRTFVQQIREYRNVVVHDIVVGQIVIPGGRLVPRKEKIQKYRGLLPVLEAAHEPERVKRDFVSMERQMAEDFEALQTKLNGVWQRALGDLTRLMYEERNNVVLAEYQLSFEND